MASTRYPLQFRAGDEYEMFEFDIGSTFIIPTLPVLMIPRPLWCNAVMRTAWPGMSSSVTSMRACWRLYTRLGLSDRHGYPLV
jgi:hypothetical protein